MEESKEVLVKERISIAIIYERLNNLITRVDEGFKGVHERQDLANGKLNVHDGLLKQQKIVNLILGAVAGATVSYIIPKMFGA